FDPYGITLSVTSHDVCQTLPASVVIDIYMIRLVTLFCSRKKHLILYFYVLSLWCVKTLAALCTQHSCCSFQYTYYKEVDSMQRLLLTKPAVFLSSVSPKLCPWGRQL
uniref:Uncharacterized protein n=1 Tax=Oryzias latipes TaxID=8090 RepID=A0A3P9LND1_ORYLA